jgi:PAS domain S-box-containing protein
MNWAIAGVVYAAAYAALTVALADQGWTRTLVGNIGLLLPPFSLMIAVARRFGAWRGRQAVFWGAIGGLWPALWFIGQAAWASEELLRATPLPWFKWPILLQLCASALPLIALVARPHRSVEPEKATTVALDIAVLVFLTGFLYWSLIIAPGMNPAHAPIALLMLATIGPLVRLASVVGLVAAALSAKKSPWATAYLRIAVGLIPAFAALILMSLSAVRGDYRTGAPADIGWILPFFFAAWAASTSPASPPEDRTDAHWGTRHASPALLFVALIAVPIVGYVSAEVMPLGPELDRLRALATALTVVAGIALVMLRLRVERGAAEQANQRVRLLATACEQAGELVVIVRGNLIVYANDAFCRAVGYTREELERVAPIDLVAPESRADLPALREQILERLTVRANTVMARRDRSTFPASWVAAPILDDASRVTHVVGVVRDVTEDIRLRSQIVRSERLSAIGEFVSGVAHEINNPLQSIIGTLELILERPQDPALRADLERTRFEAGRAGRIVRNLLTFVRRAPTERVLIDLNETVKSTVAIRSYELELAGVRVVEDYAAVLPLVLASRDEIQEVLLHLIINAQQAMTEGGPTRVLTIRTHLVAEDAVVDVHDTGPGVPAALAGKIFEPFFTTKAIESGAGLGLSMSLGIAHAHKGNLELVPSATGSLFRLTLPGAGFAGPALEPVPAASAGFGEMR